MARNVVVTGLDVITSLGLDLESTWNGLVEGKNGVSRISQFDPSTLTSQIASQIPAEFEGIISQYIKKRSGKQMTRMCKASFITAVRAVEKSGIDFSTMDPARCGVVLGVVRGGESALDDDNPKTRIVRRMNNAFSAWISLHYSLLGPNYTVTTACASSAYAIAQGYDLIANGHCDAVIVGGADSVINPEELQGFGELFALSTRNNNPEKASCPFSLDRDGFVAGEGAGMIVLEAEDHARRRGADIFARVAGYALTSEAYNIMAPMKNGEGMAHTIRAALHNAGLNPEDVGYLNAHGTSTILNDRYETLAMKQVFGDLAYKIPVSSTKSMIGHTIGAAGAIESIASIMSLRTGIIHPTINYENPDPELDLDYVPNESREVDLSAVLSNSFAFGGHNACLAYTKV